MLELLTGGIIGYFIGRVVAKKVYEQIPVENQIKRDIEPEERKRKVRRP